MKLVKYSFEGAIATITMDDGDKNLISPQMIKELNAALDQAEKDSAVVILTGREGIFSAGFDLKILKTGALNTFKMLIGGFELAARILAFSTPVVIACNGHAVAMGVFLLLSGDYRIGASGPFKIVANEVAIGLTMPYAAIEICRQRLSPAHFERATLLSEQYNPDTAVEAGFLDTVVSADHMLSQAIDKASQFSKLDLKAHYQSKLRSRNRMHNALNKAIRKDRIDFVSLGVSRVFGKLMKRK